MRLSGHTCPGMKISYYNTQTGSPQCRIEEYLKRKIPDHTYPMLLRIFQPLFFTTWLSWQRKSDGTSACRYPDWTIYNERLVKRGEFYLFFRLHRSLGQPSRQNEYGDWWPPIPVPGFVHAVDGLAAIPSSRCLTAMWKDSQRSSPFSFQVFDPPTMPLFFYAGSRT